MNQKVIKLNPSMKPIHLIQQMMIWKSYHKGLKELLHLVELENSLVILLLVW